MILIHDNFIGVFIFELHQGEYYWNSDYTSIEYGIKLAIRKILDYFDDTYWKGDGDA
jgi:hypothetical protein